MHLLKPDLQSRVERVQEHQKQVSDVHAKPRLLAVGDLVYVKNFSQGLATSPTWLATWDYHIFYGVSLLPDYIGRWKECLLTH